jgi:hypothetical protein
MDRCILLHLDVNMEVAHDSESQPKFPITAPVIYPVRNQGWK